jgi:hypothetical protein
MGFVLRPLSYLQIHCWGGLGSQMYAWALFEKLQVKFPNKKFKLVFHTGGVTKRLPDLESLFTKSEKDFVQDFESSGNSISSKSPNKKLGSTIKKSFTRPIKQVLISTGFVASANNETEFSKLKPWAISVRGHYSELRIDLETILLMKTRAESSGSNFSINVKQNKDLDVLHYRLGDLLSLAEKSPIKTKRITNAILEAKAGTTRDVWVLSDSPSQAVELLQREDQEIRVKLDDGSLDAWESLIAMSNANIFIGTNSKLSIWAIIFRALLLQEAPSYISTEVKHHVVANLADAERSGVNFY